MESREVPGGFEFSESFSLDVKVRHQPHKDFTVVEINGGEYHSMSCSSIPDAVSSALSRYIDSFLKYRLDRLANADLSSR